MQVDGIDYNEIFLQVVKYTLIRLLLSMVAHFNMYLEQMDVKIAFFHGELEDKILMKQPKGYECKGKEDHVCMLKR